MSVGQNYGALRVVRVRLPDKTKRQKKYPIGWLPEERLVYLLTRRETTIGRALNNDLILMDPTVSREHARLVLDDNEWYIYNTTEQNVIHVNGHLVAAGAHVPIHSQDFLVLGSTMLQLIAPNAENAENAEKAETLPEAGDVLQQLVAMPPVTSDTLALDDFPETPAHNGQESHLSILSSHMPNESHNHRKTQYVSADNIPVLHDEGQNGSTPEMSSAQDMAALDMEEWPDEEKLLGSSITMQFALPQRLKWRAYWIIGGIGITVVLLIALVALVVYNLADFLASVQQNPWGLISIFAIPIMPALGISLLVNFVDRFEREPWFLRLAAFLWGAIIAIPPTDFLEKWVDTLRPVLLGPNAPNVMHALFSALNAGIIEESFKGLGLLLLFFVLRDEFDNVTDGIVYGALIGAGFAMVEDFMYFGGNPKSILFLVIGRIVLGWLSHSTFTVCFGAALGYIRHTRVRWQHFIIPLIGYLVSVSLHTVFDFVNFFVNALVLNNPGNARIVTFSLFASIGDYLPPFIAQMVILYALIKSLAHEAAIIREFLASEVSNGIVTVDEYALLPHSFMRTRIERRVLFRHGIKQWLRVKALYQTEIGLAFRKWHVSMGDKPKLGYIQPEDAYRRRIQHLRQEILTTEQQTTEWQTTTTEQKIMERDPLSKKPGTL